MKRLVVGLARLSLAVFLLVSASSALAGSPGLEEPGGTLTGVLTVMWGDQADGAHTPAIYRLHQGDGRVIELIPGPSAGDLLAARGQTLQVSGQWVTGRPAGPGVLDAGAPGFLVERIEHSLGQQRAEAGGQMSGSHPWITLLCRFNDNPAAPRDLAYFQGMYDSTPGRLDHYWRELSYQQTNIAGSQAAGWFVLPKPRAGYNVNGDTRRFNLDQAASDCTAAADAVIDFSRFVGINLMFNDNLDGYAWGGQHWFSSPLDGVQYFYVTWEPPWGYADITVLKHEMGHGFGLPHSAYSDAIAYDNVWDVMSDAWAGCYTAPAFRDAVYGCMGQGTIAYHRDRLGWIAAEQKARLAPGTSATLELDWLGAPDAAHYRMIEIPVGSDGRFYTVEARGYTYSATLNPWPGYDQKFQPFLGRDGGRGVVIHSIDPRRSNPAHVIDVDGNGNTADAGSYLLPGETFSSADDQVTIRVLSQQATGMTVQVSNGVSLHAPKGVTISGPDSGYTYTPYTFTAMVLPLDLTAPVTYTWTATGQEAVVYRGGSSNTVSFAWAAPGMQTISVKAANALGSASQSLTFPVFAPEALQSFCPADKKCVFMPLAQR